MPAIAPNIPEPSCIVAISHPTNAPLMTRAESPIPQMPPRTSNTAATGVKVRSPETKPRPRASKRAVTPRVLPGCARRIDQHSRVGSSQTQFHARPTVDCPAHVPFGSNLRSRDNVPFGSEADIHVLGRRVRLVPKTDVGRLQPNVTSSGRGRRPPFSPHIG